MSKPVSTSADARFFLMAALSGLLELPLLWTLAGRGWPAPPAAALLLHVLAAGAAFLAPPRERGYLRPTRHWGEALGLLTLLLPGVGWLMGAWLVAAHGGAHRDKEAYRFEDEAEEDANPMAAAGSPSAIRRELADALDVVPAADALLGADPALKRGAIEALAKIRTPEAVAWITRVRADPDPEVRFYATAALTGLRRDFEMAIRAAEREVFARPGDLAPQVSFQRVRYEYARSGLLEPAARGTILAQCREWLSEPSSRDGAAAGLLYLVERELDPERALALLDRLAEAEPERRPRWIRERAALLFELGRHGEARGLMAELREDLLAPQAAAGADPASALEWKSAALWWTHG